MLKQIQAGMMKKCLWVKKGPAVQGSVCIHFHSKNVKDIVLTDFAKVDVFQRMNIQSEDITKSNLEALMLKGHIIAV